MGKLVSVVIPTYKDRGGLRRTLDSVLNQTYDNIEIIVVDDNGKGAEAQIRTAETMSRYHDQKNVHYLIHETNKNGAAARNTGIKASNGEYIAFLDDDDFFKPDKIKEQTEYLEAHPEFDCVYCKVESDGFRQETSSYEGDCSLPLLLGMTSMYTPSLQFRREALAAIGGFDESFRRHQDYELLLKYFSQGYKIGYLPKSLLVLGGNAGENCLHGNDLIQLKEKFLNQFSNIINELDKKHPGSRNIIYAHHYAAVFIDCLKYLRFIRALKTAVKYAPMSPKYFFGPIFRSAQHFIRKKI